MKMFREEYGMDVRVIRKFAGFLTLGTMILLLFGGDYVPGMKFKFFIGAFGIGAGLVLMVVSNIIALNHDD